MQAYKEMQNEPGNSINEKLISLMDDNIKAIFDLNLEEQKEEEN